MTPRVRILSGCLGGQSCGLKGRQSLPVARLGLKVSEAARLRLIHKWSLLAWATDGSTAWTDGETIASRGHLVAPRPNGDSGSHRLRLFSAQTLEGWKVSFIYLLIYQSMDVFWQSQGGCKELRITHMLFCQFEGTKI